MGPARVLFVDDEPNIRLTLPAILNLHGFEVTPAATVAEGLRAIQAQGFACLDLHLRQIVESFLGQDALAA
jgi:DNA-binding response OmpR family regulator